jgi:hypothetical protein
LHGLRTTFLIPNSIDFGVVNAFAVSATAGLFSPVSWHHRRILSFVLH